MQSWKVYVAASIAALMLMTWSASPAADDRPSGFLLLKQHPEFATLTRITDVTRGGVVVDITLCRQKGGKCERFESDAKSMDDLADYVYLFAVYKGNYAPQKPGTRKTLASALLQEAQDSGSGKALLELYGDKTACAGKQDVPQCVLHSLYKSIGVQRYIVERNDGGGVYILTANEDGVGDPFEG